MRNRLKKLVSKLKSHYDLFGIPGIVLAMKARFKRQQIQVKFKAPGVDTPLHLRLWTSDVAIFSDVFLSCQYDSGLLLDPEVIIDAGANIGMTSVFCAIKYPRARIFSIEPEPSNFELLRLNTMPYQNITPIRAALWKEDCDLNIFDPGFGPWGFQIKDVQESPSGNDRRNVPGLTLGRLMREHKIEHVDLLKVDIEGAEKEVFSFSQEWIDRVGALAIELHDRFNPGCTETVLAAAKGFACNWQNGETTFFLRKRPVESSAVTQKLLTPVCRTSAKLVKPFSVERVSKIALADLP